MVNMVDNALKWVNVRARKGLQGNDVETREMAPKNGEEWVKMERK